MTVPVRYHCPRCETVVTLQRSASMADKSVTPYPLDGWEYAAMEGAYEDADGVRIVCGDGETDGEGCGESYYLNFVRFEGGREVVPVPDSERVRLASEGPRGPARPRSPGDPDR